MPPAKKINLTKKDVLDRSVKRRNKKRIGRLMIWLFAVLIIGGLIIYLLYCPYLTIKKVVVQGNRVLETETVNAYLDQVLNQRYWHLFPKRNIFIYPKKQLAQELLSQFPRLADVSLGLGEFDELVVTLKERSSDLLWCPETGEETITGTSTSSSAGQCYFSDPSGFIFAQAPNFSGPVFVKVISPLPPNPLGFRPLLLDSYQVVSAFSRYLPKIFTVTANQNYRLLAVKIADPHTFVALVVDTTTNQQWSIYFDDEDSADDQANHLYTVLESAPFRKDMLDHKNQLATIDLRYGQKVFYTFK